MHCDQTRLVDDDGNTLGEFSSHWAACAAMIRLSDPSFKSTGGDKEADLAIEAIIAGKIIPRPLDNGATTAGAVERYGNAIADRRPPHQLSESE